MSAAVGAPAGAAADSRLGLLRELGEQAVLEAIFRRGPATRPEIASATGLSKPTRSRRARWSADAHDRLLAIGISTPGVVDRDTGRVRLAYNVSPDGALDPLAAIGSPFGVPVLLDNNINLAALGEKAFGLARGVSTMVFIGIGAGVGMGIIMHDELVRGAHGAAGEIAYLPLVGDPFDPRHKLHGGLEDEIGAAGVLAAFGARAPGRGGEVSTAQDVFELARTGDGDAGAVVDHIAARVGSAIATVCAILDPELVVLGGGIGSSPLLLSPVRGAAAALVPLTARIETSLLGDQAALRGTIAFALHAARSQLIPQSAAIR